MEPLNPEARRVLKLARAARTPSQADKQRVARGVVLAGLAALSSTAPAKAQATPSAQMAASLSAPLAKWCALGGLVAAASIAMTVAFSPRSEIHHAARPTAELAPIAREEVEASPAAVQTAPAAQATKVTEKRPQRPEGRRRPSTLEEELTLLHDAQRAWRERDPAHALRLLREHARQYPRSALRLERESIEVLALCELGSTGEARRLAHRLFARAPSAPMRAAIERSCALR